MQSVGFEYLKLLVMFKVPNDVERPVRGAGPWSGSHAGEADREVVLSRVAAKTKRIVKKNSRLMKEMNPTKLQKFSVLWEELASLEKSRQHCVEQEKSYRDYRFDGGFELAGYYEVDYWNEWTESVHRNVLAWERAIRRERLYRICLLQKQLELMRLELLERDNSKYYVWANEKMLEFKHLIESDFDNLSFCPENHMVWLMESMTMPVWLLTSCHMWEMEGCKYTEL